MIDVYYQIKWFSGGDQSHELQPSPRCDWLPEIFRSASVFLMRSYISRPQLLWFMETVFKITADRVSKILDMFCVCWVKRLGGGRKAGVNSSGSDCRAKSEDLASAAGCVLGLGTGPIAAAAPAFWSFRCKRGASWCGKH